ncbi:GntR family transcriptional regulator [Flindersiella endophytica]
MAVVGGQERLSLEQPISRGDRVRDALQEAILDGRLRQGAPLVERELSAWLGVSKTPIREALKQLRSSGLVVANSYQGMSVRTLDAATVRDVSGARSVVEPEAVRQAVVARGARPSPGARQALEEAAALLETGQPAQLGLVNRRFHHELYTGCGNELLVDFLDKLQGLNAFIATAGWRASATYDSEWQEHSAILSAYEAGDAALAARLLREHIERSAEGALRSLAAGDPS